MSSRRRKNLPPGTFIPTSQRIMVILQLCLAFSLMISYLVQPFMGEYFTLRSRMLLYEYVMGTSEILKVHGEPNPKSERQMERFKQLSEKERQLLLTDYQKLQNYASRSTLQKIYDGISTLFREVPPFEQAWIFFSITIAILLLLKFEGAKQAAWILPLIVLMYSVDNQVNGKAAVLSPDVQLFPQEQIIVEHYLEEPLSNVYSTQKKQLETGWGRFLIKNWSDQPNNQDGANLEKAEFQFTIARLNLLHNQPRSEWLNRFHEKSNLLTLVLFLGWNGFFAWIVSRPNTGTSSQSIKWKIPMPAK